MNNFAEEKIYAFIFGEESLDNFNAFVEQIKGLGIDRAVEIKQAAYDRYMARSAK